MNDILVDFLVPIITAFFAYLGARANTKAQIKLAKENNEAEIKKLKIQHQQELERLEKEIESKAEMNWQYLGIDLTKEMIREIMKDPRIKKQLVSEISKENKRK